MPEIKPALTPKEWESRTVWLDTWGSTEAAITPTGMVTIEDNDYYAGFTKYTERRHALAALCLYDLPEGFTAHDVTSLVHFGDTLDVAEGVRPFFYELAARIAALLPPVPPER